MLTARHYPQIAINEPRLQDWLVFGLTVLSMHISKSTLSNFRMHFYIPLLCNAWTPWNHEAVHLALVWVFYAAISFKFSTGSLVWNLKSVLHKWKLVATLADEACTFYLIPDKVTETHTQAKYQSNWKIFILVNLLIIIYIYK